MTTTSEPVYTRRSSDKDADTPLRSGCGTMVLIRTPDGRAVFQHVACHMRSCPACGPKVVEAKMSAIPLDAELHRVVLDNDAVATFLRRLQRLRRKGKGGEYVRVPISASQVWIVNDAGIGEPTTRLYVKSRMVSAPSKWGCITRSRAWSTDNTRPPRGEYVCEGIVTKRIADFQPYADRVLRQKGYETSHSLTYSHLTERQHATLCELAGLVANRHELAEWRERRVAAQWDRRTHNDTDRRFWTEHAA